ncbi:hypothetical protein DPMN_093848 [Dreissena polymorpha]|uniref:Uncharacterized protein n=1 Tax=Dreissena polymorpha TaxID=45954 RepID=A0A9D4R245_DREPO|nr:hypothetical protein DPMN_093848 [Dreissena polymorpha]
MVHKTRFRQSKAYLARLKIRLSAALELPTPCSTAPTDTRLCGGDVLTEQDGNNLCSLYCYQASTLTGTRYPLILLRDTSLSHDFAIILIGRVPCGHQSVKVSVKP